MLNRALAFVAALALAGALGLGWYTASIRAENKRLSATVSDLQLDLTAAQKLRKTDQAVAVRAAQRIAALTTSQRITDAKLAEALAGNAAWADQNVPADVAAALGLQLPAPP